MKRIVIGIVGLVVLLAGAVIFAPGLINWSKYETQITRHLTKATGYEYNIGGAMELAVIPYPRVVIEDVAVTKPGGQKPFVSLGNASVQAELWPLLRGQVIVSSVTLDTPEIHLTRLESGELDIMTSELEGLVSGKGVKQTGGEGGGTTAGSVALNEVQVKNGSFVFGDRMNEASYNLSNINVTLTTDSLKGPFKLDGGFRYNGQDIQANLKTGRVDNLSESVALQFDIRIPDQAASLSYSGVMAYDGYFEAQGETSLKTSDLAKFASIAGVEAPALLAQPFSSKGLLTWDQQEFSYNNLQVSFSKDFEAGGNLVAKKPVGGRPMDVNLSLEARKPFSVDEMLKAAGTPQAQKNNSKSAGAAKNRRRFLPETFTLPFQMTAKADFKADEVKFRGTTLNYVSMTLTKTKEAVSGNVVVQVPGGEKSFNANIKTAFGAVSKDPKSKAVTYSDPVISIDGFVNLGGGEDSAQNIASFLNASDMTEIFLEGMRIDAVSTVKPQAVDVSSLSVELLDNRFFLSGVYKIGGSDKADRDLVDVALETSRLDVRKWQSRIFPETASGPLPAADDGKGAFRVPVPETLPVPALPFDVQLTATIDDAQYDGVDYDQIFAKGRLSGKTLTVESAGVKDQETASVTINGSIGDIEAMTAINLSLAAKSRDWKKLLQTYDVTLEGVPEETGEAEFVTEVSGNIKALGFTTNLSALRGKVEASGTAHDIAGKKPYLSDLTVRLRHPSYVELVRYYKPDFKGGIGIDKTLDFYSKMKREGKIYSFSDLKFTLGPSTFSGVMSADMSGKKPQVKADLSYGTVPLNKILGVRARHKGMVKARPLQKSRANEVKWSRNAIPADWMHVMGFDLKAAGHRVEYEPWVLENPVLDVQMKNGILTVNSFKAGLFGGSVNGSGRIESSSQERQPVSVAAGMAFENVLVNSLVDAFAGGDVIKAKGTASLNLDVKTSGLSPAALMFDLDGKGSATGQNLIMQGFDLAELSRALAKPSSSMTENFSTLVRASTSGGTTEFDKLDAQFQIAEGVVNFDTFKLTGPAADVTNTGKINLPLWTLDMDSRVDLKGAQEAPPLKVSFSGPLDSPGHTFGQRALESYFQNMLQKKIEGAITDKLREKGILPGAQETPAQQPAPQQQTESAGKAANDNTQQQPAPQQQPETREPRPEDAIFGILEGVLKEAQ